MYVLQSERLTNVLLVLILTVSVAVGEFMIQAEREETTLYAQIPIDFQAEYEMEIIQRRSIENDFLALAELQYMKPLIYEAAGVQTANLQVTVKSPIMQNFGCDGTMRIWTAQNTYPSLIVYANEGILAYSRFSYYNFESVDSECIQVVDFGPVPTGKNLTVALDWYQIVTGETAGGAGYDGVTEPIEWSFSAEQLQGAGYLVEIIVTEVLH